MIRVSSRKCLKVASIWRVTGIGLARHQIADPGHDAAQFGKMIDGPVRPLVKVDSVLAIEQAFNEAIEFLEADQTVLAQIRMVGSIGTRVNLNGWLRF